MYENFQSIAQVIPRLLMSGLLLGVAFLCLSETVRLWVTGPWVISPFAFFEKGVESKTEGVAFAQQVFAEVAHQNELLRNTRRPISKGTATVTVGPSLPDLAPVELPRVALDNVEINVQGVNLTSLARSLSRWINPPLEITGSVTANGAATTVQVLLQDRGRAAGQTPVVFRTADHPSRESAISATASHLLFIFLQQKPQVFNGMDGDTFSTYVSLVKEYAGVLSARQEGRIAGEDYKQKATLLAGRIGTLSARTPNSSPVLRLLIFSDMDVSDYVAARRDLESYLKLFPDDKEILLIKQELDSLAPQTPNTLLAAAGAEPAAMVNPEIDGKSPAEFAKGKVPGIPTQREIHRPIQPGISVGSQDQSGAGTICCLVRDPAGNVFALSSEHVLFGKLGSNVLQPGPLDGGTEKDRIGRLAQLISSKGVRRAVGALASVEVPWDARATTAVIAAPVAPQLGSEVTCLGRTSGATRGRIVSLNMTVMIGDADGKPQRYSGVFQVKSDTASPFSSPGDSGAPVLSANGNNLVGMLYAGDDNSSYCIPIGPILEALKVTPILGEEHSP